MDIELDSCNGREHCFFYHATIQSDVWGEHLRSNTVLIYWPSWAPVIGFLQVSECSCCKTPRQYLNVGRSSGTASQHFSISSYLWTKKRIKTGHWLVLGKNIFSTEIVRSLYFINIPLKCKSKVLELR